MADQEIQTAATQTQSTPGAGQVQGTTQTPAAGGGGDAPWAAKGFKDTGDVWKAYTSLEGKLGEQGNELGTYKQAYERMAGEHQQYQQAVQACDKWYKDNLGPHWNDVEKFLQTRRGQQVAAGVAQATGAQANATQNWAEGWETLTPQQQAQRLQEVSVQQMAGALTPALQNWQKQFVGQVQQQIEQKEAYFNNYLNLYRKVMDMRMQNPSLDVDAVLDQAVKVLGGQVDPIELGRQLATMTTDKESYAKQLVDQARKDWDTEQKNKEMESLTPRAGGTPPAFKLSNAGNTKGGLTSMREQVAKTILEKHGPGIF